MKIKAKCIKQRLAQATYNGEDPDSVARVAERAERSPRTITRILRYRDEKLLDYYDADRLLIAAGGHLDVDCGPEDEVDDGAH